MAFRTRYDLKVTEEDLDTGKVGDSYNCMAVRAIAKQVPDAHQIAVDTQSVAFNTFDDEGGKIRLTYLTPPVLQQYIIDFDAGLELWPFRFRLNEPHLTKRPKSGKARSVASAKSREAKKEAIKEGATEEEAKAASSAAYQAAKNAAFEKAHAVHDELVAQGVPDAVERAAEAAGLLPAVSTPHARHEDPLFTTIDRKTEGRAPTPKVFKKRARSYGQRALRINWPIDPVTGDRIKPEVTRLV